MIPTSKRRWRSAGAIANPRSQSGKLDESRAMVILDSDHLSLLEWEESPPAKRLAERLSTLPIEEVCSTIVNFEEQARGWLGALSGARKVVDQIEIYRRLLKTVRMFCGLSILPFDSLAAAE